MRALLTPFLLLASLGSCRADDSATIQALVDALPTTGVVHLACGNYQIGTAIVIPSNVPRARIYGDGDCTKLTATNGNAIFSFPGQGYYGFALDHMELDGQLAVGVPAIDETPSSPAYAMGKAHFEHLYLKYWRVGWRLRSAQLNRFENFQFSGGAGGGVVFELSPEAGSNHHVGSNIARDCLVNGPDVAMFSYGLQTVGERAANWRIEGCDFQATGTTPQLIVGDSDWQVVNNVFENSTSQNIIVVAPTGAAGVPTSTLIANNVLTGGSTQGKIRIEGANGQRPFHTTLLGNNSSGAMLVDIVGAVSTVMINNRGGINNTGDSYSTTIGTTP